MPVRKAEAEWKGDLQQGSGRMSLSSGSYEGAYSFKSRFKEGEEGGTNPEELIGAAHAGCFSMALSNILAQAGHTPDRVHTTASVHLNQVEGGFAIQKIDLHTEAEVPGLDQAAFQQHAQKAKENCPVSKALSAITITVDAKLNT